MLQVIHELEPSGVGAQDLQECLLLQLKHKKHPQNL
jgi:RNA polymerase sigma-54 factor